MHPIARANTLAAEALVEEFARAGIHEACVSPGSRSTPVALALARQPAIRKWLITDERAAAFFALGAARQSGQPVVILCTSGTAAANFAPAVAEAALAEVPLIVITADRPTELRDCGAAQTIRQPGLFASHARWSVDAPTPDGATDLETYFRTLACRAAAVARGLPMGPVHLNLPFREPLLDTDAAAEAMSGPERRDGQPRTTVYQPVMTLSPDSTDAAVGLLRAARRGLIICGPRLGPGMDAAAVVRVAAALRWPVLADPLSGVRFGRHDRSGVVNLYDILVRDDGFCAHHRPDIVLRFGALPTSKPLQRFLSTTTGAEHLLVASPGTWPDPLGIATHVFQVDAAHFCDAINQRLAPDAIIEAGAFWLASWLHADALVHEVVAQLLASDPEMLEGRIPSEVTRLLGDGSLLMVGNGMPVRDLDTFAAGSDMAIDILANRGANGIDGVLSTALGAAAVHPHPAALIVGDLSFLHDLGGLQIAARYPLGLVVILVHNDGGGIFSFLPQVALGETFERYFATPHGLDVEPVVRMCGGTFVRATTWSFFRRAVLEGVARGGLTVVEVRTDRAQNLRHHRELVASVLDRWRGETEPA